MPNQVESMDQSGQLAREINEVYARRAQAAQERFSERMQKALDAHLPAPMMKAPWEIWQDWFQYSTDFAQRSLMFWDTLRQRAITMWSTSRPDNPRYCISTTRSSSTAASAIDRSITPWCASSRRRASWSTPNVVPM